MERRRFERWGDAGRVVVALWAILCGAASRLAEAQLLVQIEKPDLPKRPFMDWAWGALTSAETVFFVGFMILVALFLLMVYERYFSHYLPGPKFRAPAVAKLAALIVPPYGLLCAVFGLFAARGNQVALTQTGLLGPTVMVGGGLAVTGLGMRAVMGNRMAGILLVLLLMMDSALNVFAPMFLLHSTDYISVRAWAGVFVLLTALWSLGAVVRRWRLLREKQRDLRSLSGTR